MVDKEMNKENRVGRLEEAYKGLIYKDFIVKRNKSGKNKGGWKWLQDASYSAVMSYKDKYGEELDKGVEDFNYNFVRDVYNALEGSYIFKEGSKKGKTAWKWESRMEALEEVYSNYLRENTISVRDELFLYELLSVLPEHVKRYNVKEDEYYSSLFKELSLISNVAISDELGEDSYLIVRARETKDSTTNASYSGKMKGKIAEYIISGIVGAGLIGVSLLSKFNLSSSHMINNNQIRPNKEYTYIVNNDSNTSTMYFISNKDKGKYSKKVYKKIHKTAFSNNPILSHHLWQDKTGKYYYVGDYKNLIVEGGNIYQLVREELNKKGLEFYNSSKIHKVFIAQEKNSNGNKVYAAYIYAKDKLGNKVKEYLASFLPKREKRKGMNSKNNTKIKKINKQGKEGHFKTLANSINPFTNYYKEIEVR